MEREQLKSLLIFANENGIYANEIEPSRRGTTVGDILKGKISIMTCTPKKIKELESNTIRLLNERGIVYAHILDTASEISITPHKDGIEKRVEQLEKDIELIKAENRELRKLLLELQNTSRPQSPKIEDKRVKATDNIMGFTLQKRKDYWYAGKSINGKLKWVYVGKDKNLAGEKISKWVTLFSKETK